MSSDATPEQSSADGYVQRAKLLAELGRYDEAAAEVSYAVALEPANAGALTLLSRLHLAAGRPAEALTAADAAIAAAPGIVAPLLARGMALADLERYAEAARTADEILAVGPDDAYAQRNAAAILAGSRNGQTALNAAWRGVQLAPEEPEAHLVLGLVAANMQMFDLAEQAYARRCGWTRSSPRRGTTSVSSGWSSGGGARRWSTSPRPPPRIRDGSTRAGRSRPACGSWCSSARAGR